MIKRIFAFLLMAMLLVTCVTAFADPASEAVPAETQQTQEVSEEAQAPVAQAAPAEYVSFKEQFAGILEQFEGADHDVYVKGAVYDAKAGTVTIEFANKGDVDYKFVYGLEGDETAHLGAQGARAVVAQTEVEIKANSSKKLTEMIAFDKAPENGDCKVNVLVQYMESGAVTEYEKTNAKGGFAYFEDVVSANVASSGEEVGAKEAVTNFLKQTGFSMIIENVDWKSVVMILIACLLLYLAIVKGFEPLLLLPIAFGMLLTNLVGSEVFHEEIFAGGHVHWDMFGTNSDVTPGLVDILYLGVKLGIYPCLIFIGVGAMTDFGPLIANPKSLLLGAAAQIGIFATFIGASLLGFNPQEAGSIGIIGGADGPTAIFLTSKLAPHLLGPIAVAAYSYMALVPVIQPPIMKALTTKKEREIVMKELRPVSKTEKIVFPIVTTIFVALLVPSAAPLVGCLMLGNLLKESGVCERLSKTVQNELMNIVTVFLGVSVGATATASTFLAFGTLKIILMGIVAFGVATACGLLLAKFMNLFLKEKINPLIGSAGVSAVPMAARVSQKVGQEANPSNFLLMHAMGPNVAGVIGSAIAAGALLAMLG